MIKRIPLLLHTYVPRIYAIDSSIIVVGTSNRIWTEIQGLGCLIVDWIEKKLNSACCHRHLVQSWTLFHFLDFQNVPNLWSTTVKCQKNFYDGIEPKIGFEEYGCVTENLNIFAMAQSLIIQIILVSRWRRIIQDWIALEFIFLCQ